MEGIALSKQGNTDERTSAIEAADRADTQRAGAYSQLPALIRQLGLDPVEMMGLAGLPADALDSPERRVPYGSLGTLLARTSERAACPHVGLLVGRMWRVADLGLVGELVSHAPTFGTALRMWTVHQHLNSSAGMAFLIEQGVTVEFGYCVYGKRVEGVELLHDAVLAGATILLREMAGPEFALSQVHLLRRRPADVAPYRAHFRLVPRFGAERSALCFPARWMAHPMQGADAARFAEAKRRIAGAGSGSLLQRVRRAVRRLLLSDDVSGDAVAQMLDLHRRTLNRRLEAQGTTFQAVLDDVRAEAARQLLESSDASLDDVAASLGYAGVSPFMRAFRRWTGTTPGEWRRRPRPPAVSSGA